MQTNNAYPEWWCETVTLYNKHIDKLTSIVTWYRTVLHNCFWANTDNRLTVGDVELKANDVICRIPENEKYLPKKKWIELSNDTMGEYFTLGTGDILIQGEVDDIIDEYRKGYRSTDLISKYKNFQGCININRWSDNTGVGRVNPHYLVSGT